MLHIRFFQHFMMYSDVQWGGGRVIAALLKCFLPVCRPRSPGMCNEGNGCGQQLGADTG